MGSPEARQRQAGQIEDGLKRKEFDLKQSKESESGVYCHGYEKGANFERLALKLCLCLALFVLGSSLILMFSPAMDTSSGFREGWLWERRTDERYVSDEEINWFTVSSILGNLSKQPHEKLKVGVLNFNQEDIQRCKQEISSVECIPFQYNYAANDVTWEKLYPEWISEEGEFEVPVCPHLPLPSVSRSKRIHVVAVKLPCKKWMKNWSRDVARLHLQLAAAKLAVSGKGDEAHVLIITECWPIPNLFKCNELLVHDSNLWFYAANVKSLQQKLMLPVGSCQLVVPVHSKARNYTGDRRREAYATVLHSAEIYVCGAIAVAKSIRLTGSKRDLVILVDSSISQEHREGLQDAGWKLKEIERIRNPKSEHGTYNEWNYSKFRLWQLTEYDKIIFIDADMLILRNIDFLFGIPEVSATGNNGTLFNSGVMIIEPSNCTFQLLMDNINSIESYNGGDQGYLNEIFTWWHRLPRRMNFLKHFWATDPEERQQEVEQKTYLFGADPPILYVLHYLGQKPWLCYRDYDCNWNNILVHQFASDVAHARWWKVYDSLQKTLQKFCLINSERKATLEWDRRQAEAAKLPDEHWKWKITDPRLQICNEEVCHRESTLKHWDTPDNKDNATASSPSTVVGL